MVRVIKSAVKCYKKKTKKTVGGKTKIYEYNQYLIPLKKSDDLECSEDVFILSQKQLNDITGREVSDLNQYFEDLIGYQGNVEEYENTIAEMEWKKSELSKSYQDLVTKNAKTNKKLKIESQRVKDLEETNQRLLKDIGAKNMEYQDLKKKYDFELEKNKVMEEEINEKDKDIWSSLKSRLGSSVKKEQDEEGK
jgi:chromosome segregation ATPase